MAAVDVGRLRHLEAQGLLKSFEHPTRDLVGWNYTQHCQFEKAWDEYTLMCRGLILNGEGEVVARPLPKFKNWEEHDGPIPSSEPEVYQKLDGSLLISALENGYAPIFATRGSFKSEQAQWAEEFMLRNYGPSWMEPGWTYCFEIIYPENRIVCDYGNRKDLVLLAKINTRTGEEADIYRVPEWKGSVVDQFYFDHPLDPATLKSHNEPNEEGYVLFWRQEGLRLKIKFEDYVRLHRILTGVHARHIWEYMREGKSLAPLIEQVPDEFLAWVEETQNELLDRFCFIEHEAKRAFFMRPVHANRGEFARWAQEQPSHLRPILFKLLDGAPYDDVIWKQIKPAADRPFRMSDAA